MKKYKDLFIQFFKFGIVGVSGAAVNYLVFVATIYVLERLGLFLSIDYYIAQFLAFVISVGWSFYWNSTRVFSENKEPILKALFKMYLTYAFTGIVLCYVLLYIEIELLNMSKLLAPLINSVINMPINYLISKYWTFRGKDEKRQNS